MYDCLSVSLNMFQDIILMVLDSRHTKIGLCECVCVFIYMCKCVWLSAERGRSWRWEFTKCSGETGNVCTSAVRYTNLIET